MFESESRWKNLLEWLSTHGMDISPHNLKVEARVTPYAGYGLFALNATPPSSPLFTVPANALLNISTISPHYPPTQPPLTAVQLLSLHLFRFRPKIFQPSLDPLYGPYISILPGHFDFHPVTWLWKKRKRSFVDDPCICLLNDVPPSIFYSLNETFSRFQTDWETICRYLRKYRDFFLQENCLLEIDFLWAWLNVNTRCVYHRLMSSQSHPNNFTLCPILDFANHTTGKLHMTGRSQVHEGLQNKIGGDFTLLAPSTAVTQKDDELCLTYGAHPNRKLFVDYGFVNQVLDEGGEVDLQEPIGALFAGLGQLGEWLRQQLIDSGYWGDWTLHAHPPPAHPSYRVIMALRLYHIFSPFSNKVPPADADEIILPWLYVLQGEQDSISNENESAWRNTLLQLCKGLVSGANVAIAKVPPDNENGPEWVREMRGAIGVLWKEELHVVTAVSESILQGLQF